ncbi:hypothetical protein LG634_06900 [Streptomyces bambusae]|uniref:hypothetical protein n=1 Tax=Streptomyces bambusae TaxID=1550616 RepID=UPI001CFE28CB|nr:hypothetical protein [Streptomyces bambusae]MCB5164561.1 hypothetical protein [Streptomyces bambusae]
MNTEGSTTMADTNQVDNLTRRLDHSVTDGFTPAAPLTSLTRRLDHMVPDDAAPEVTEV